MLKILSTINFEGKTYSNPILAPSFGARRGIYASSVKNKMTKFFPFRNMKKISYLKYEKCYLQMCLEFYISLIKNNFLAVS